MRESMALRTLLAAGMFLAAVGGCSPSSLHPSASVTTLMPDTERWFKIEWETVTERAEQSRLRGHVESSLGEFAVKVQLLAQALDASGSVVGQRLEWLPGGIPGFGRVYFEIPNLPAADHYRVTVWAYERVQSGDLFR